VNTEDKILLDEIHDNLENGNWTTAMKKYKSLNCSAQEFGDAIQVMDTNKLEDIALLGFYTRDNKGI
jgi:outer membrane protein assembly factor BamD (BamD/ComL family)